MKLTVEMPDKIRLRDTRIASMETDRKGLKARLEKSWRKYLRRYTSVKVPICCELVAKYRVVRIPRGPLRHRGLRCVRIEERDEGDGIIRF